MRAETNKKVIDAYKKLMEVSQLLRDTRQAATGFSDPSDFAAYLLLTQVEEVIVKSDVTTKLLAVAKIAGYEER